MNKNWTKMNRNEQKLRKSEQELSKNKKKLSRNEQNWPKVKKNWTKMKFRHFQVNFKLSIPPDVSSRTSPIFTDNNTNSKAIEILFYWILIQRNARKNLIGIKIAQWRLKSTLYGSKKNEKLKNRMGNTITEHTQRLESKQLIHCPCS